MHIHAMSRPSSPIIQVPLLGQGLYLDWRCALFLPRATVFFIELDGGARQPASAKAIARANASSELDPLQLPLDMRVSLEASHAVWCESLMVKYSLQQISSWVRCGSARCSSATGRWNPATPASIKSFTSGSGQTSASA